MTLDSMHMRRALELARRGEGLVEPNPMVGCVIVADGQVVGEGFHERFGGAHAEINALRVAGSLARGATAFVTLEPCCHYGKTPPCAESLANAGIARVVAAIQDPFAAVAGQGFAQLRGAGIDVEVGLLADEARSLNAPFIKRVTTGRPWVIAKWAMTLDGKIATMTGDSKWISCEASRALAHELRGRVDAIVVGRGTAERDDPSLTARPPGARVALRVVVDSRAKLSSTSRLATTARETPVLVAMTADATNSDRQRLTALGCECLGLAGASPAERLDQLLVELGRRGATNVLVEGGARLLGVCHDIGQIDEVRLFVAAKIAGGADAPSAIAGIGARKIANAARVAHGEWRQVGDDLYFSGRVVR